VPVKRCQEDGRPGFKWGDQGKCYAYDAGSDAGRRRAKELAIRQGIAVEGPDAVKAGSPSAVELSSQNLRRVGKIFTLVTHVRLARHPRLGVIRAGYRARRRQEKRWTEAVEGMLDNLLDQLDLDGAIMLAHDGQREVHRASLLRRIPFLRKQLGGLALAALNAEIRAHLFNAFDDESWKAGAVQAYLGMALATSEDAGQFSLDRLGINRTFAWAQPRSMAQDLFAVRGSKVIENLVGNHLEELTKIIVRATDPTKPLTVLEVKSLVLEKWPELKDWQALRIARTETAAVWTTTSMNAYAANGITHFESLLANGPTLELQQSEPCPICVEMASIGRLDAHGELPPWHPSCRCEAVPVLEDADGNPWLPPDEPWAGGTLEDMILQELL
jgi:hypothetical protein